MHHKQTNQQQPDNYWSQLYFAAEAQQEQFTDVHVVTTRADYAEKLFDQLANRTHINSHGNLNEQLLEIHNERIVETCERVDIHNRQIRVVVNVSEIDEQATYKALRYVADALDKTGGEDGTVTFSPRFTYETHELFWLFTH